MIVARKRSERIHFVGHKVYPTGMAKFYSFTQNGQKIACFKEVMGISRDESLDTIQVGSGRVDKCKGGENGRC